MTENKPRLIQLLEKRGPTSMGWFLPPSIIEEFVKETNELLAENIVLRDNCAEKISADLVVKNSCLEKENAELCERMIEAGLLYEEDGQLYDI